MIAWLVFAASVWALAEAHRDVMVWPGPIQPDEPYITALAWRMVEGRWLPYVDGVSHRGPLLYWAAALAVWIGEPTSWLPIRVCAMLAGLSTLLFTFLAAQAARRPFAGAVAAWAVVAALLFGVGSGDGLNFNGEHILDVFAMAGLWLTVLALRDARRSPHAGLLAIAGACAGLAALSKQNGVVMLPTLGVWIVSATLARKGMAGRAKALAAFAVGAAAPIVLTVLVYAIANELEALAYYAVIYNRDVYMAPYRGARLTRALGDWVAAHALYFSVAAALTGWGLSRALAGVWVRGLWASCDREGFTLTVALGALFSLAACNLSARSFLHYYVQFIPWFALLVGLLIDAAIGPLRRSSLLQAFTIAPVALLVFQVWESRDGRMKRAMHNEASRAVARCAALDAYAPPEAPMFVWGFAADLYVWCRRRPASRFVFTSFVAGLVPWFDEPVAVENERAVPGSRDLLIRELEAEAPHLLVDAEHSLLGRSILLYPELADYVTAHYCAVDRRRGVGTIYVRRAGEPCPELRTLRLRLSH